MKQAITFRWVVGQPLNIVLLRLPLHIAIVFFLKETWRVKRNLKKMSVVDVWRTKNRDDKKRSDVPCELKALVREFGDSDLRYAPGSRYYATIKWTRVRTRKEHNLIPCVVQRSMEVYPDRQTTEPGWKTKLLKRWHIL